MKRYIALILLISLSSVELFAQWDRDFTSDFLKLEHFKVESNDAQVKTAFLYKDDGIRLKRYQFSEEGHLNTLEAFPLKTNPKYVYKYESDSLKKVIKTLNEDLIYTQTFEKDSIMHVEKIEYKSGKNWFLKKTYFNEAQQPLCIKIEEPSKITIDSFYYDDQQNITDKVRYYNGRKHFAEKTYYQKRVRSTFKQYFKYKNVTKTEKTISYKNLTEKFCSGDSCRYTQEDYLYRQGKLVKRFQYNANDELLFSFKYKYDKFGNLIEYIHAKGEAEEEIHKRFYFYTYDNLPDAMEDYLYTPEGVQETNYYYEYDYYES